MLISQGWCMKQRHAYIIIPTLRRVILRFTVNPATLAGLKVELVTFSCPVSSLAWVVSGSHAGGPPGYRHGGSWMDSL